MRKILTDLCASKGPLLVTQGQGRAMLSESNDSLIPILEILKIIFYLDNALDF